MRLNLYISFRLLIMGVVVCACFQSVHADSFGVNIYGLSYHFLDDERSRENLNEVNPGWGLRINFSSQKGDAILLEGGFFEDTFHNRARYISLCYQFRIWKQLRLGLHIARYNTRSTNYGESFFAPIPMVSYRVWRLTINGVYLPKHEPLNPFYILGAYATVDLVVNDK